MMTKELFRQDGYLQSCEATLTEVTESGFCTDQTVFYPLGGGQPGDIGNVRVASSEQIEIIDCHKDKQSGHHIHVISAGAEKLVVGDVVTLSIDWQRRYRIMRMHSCLHMLSVAVPSPVTGGSIRDGSGRLDFDLPNPPSVEQLEQSLNEIISGQHPMSVSWITDEQMLSQPDLVKTMSVKPPMNSGKVRLVKFGEADLQACGGTHVHNSSEIGKVKVESIKNKGKQNRRVTIVFDE